MNIAIIGDGAGSVAAACHMNALGISALLYTEDEEQCKKWRAFPVKEEGLRKASVHLNVTNNLHQAMAFATLIFMTVPPEAYVSTIEKIRPHLHAGQSILFFSGNWGALRCYRLLQREMDSLHLTISETDSSPWDAALSEDGIELTMRPVKESIAYASIGEDESVSATLHEICKKVTKVSSPAITSLAIAGPIIHVVNSFFNLTRIDSHEKFLFYGDAFTRRTADFMEHCDGERRAVGKALGVELFPILTMMNETRKDKAGSLYEALIDRPAAKTLYGPENFHHEYFTKELTCNVDALLDLAEMTRTPAPYLETVVRGLYLYLNKPYRPALTVQDLRALRSLT